MSAILDARCRTCGTSYRFDPDKPYPPSPTCHACLYAGFTAQAAEISRLTAALKQVQHSMAQVAIPGNDARREFELIRSTVNAALLRPQPQTAPEPETPILSRYAAEQVQKAAKP